jgi:hypothetical protein
MEMLMKCSNSFCNIPKCLGIREFKCLMRMLRPMKSKKCSQKNFRRI